MNESSDLGSPIMSSRTKVEVKPIIGLSENARQPTDGQCNYASHHRPYSRQVTERMGCNVVIHPPPSIYPKAGNGALRDQWAIKYNCQKDSSTIAFTVRDLVHWNYGISQNIPRVCKSWKSLSIYVFAAYIFFCSPDTQSTEVNFR